MVRCLEAQGWSVSSDLDDEAEDADSLLAVVWLLAVGTGVVVAAAWARPWHRALVAGALVIPVAGVVGALWLKHTTEL